jgi:hypothetical protein
MPDWSESIKVSVPCIFDIHRCLSLPGTNAHVELDSKHQAGSWKPPACILSSTEEESLDAPHSCRPMIADARDPDTLAYTSSVFIHNAVVPILFEPINT